MSNKEDIKKSCTCKHCIECCYYKPGWFLPGEAEKVAAYLGLSVQETFDKYLAVDYWERYEDDRGNILVLSPATTIMEPGTMYPSAPCGQCIFLRDNRCSIHEVKPYECRQTTHLKDQISYHEKVAFSWDKEEYQEQCHNLLMFNEKKEGK